MNVAQNEFQRRMFDGGETVYRRITEGKVTDVEAELMDVHLNASGDEDDPSTHPIGCTCIFCIPGA